jgi:hypothetical protein
MRRNIKFNGVPHVVVRWIDKFEGLRRECNIVETDRILVTIYELIAKFDILVYIFLVVDWFGRVVIFEDIPKDFELRRLWEYFGLVWESQDLIELRFLPVDNIFGNVVLQDIRDDRIKCGLDGFSVASIDNDTFSCW